MFCTAKKGIQAYDANWRGDPAYEAEKGSCNLTQYLTDSNEFDVLKVFRGAAYNDEWSFIFHQNPLEEDTAFGGTFWAEAWRDQETGKIHCWVRRLVDNGKVVFGPNPSQLYLEMIPCKNVEKLMHRMERIQWETKVPHTYLDTTKRESSRKYKTQLKKQEMHLSMAMALHERLGSGAEIQCLGTDLIQLILGN
jgi:hypothetical protein